MVRPTVPPVPTEDYWLETDTLWIRNHVVPRFVRFYPGDSLTGPSLDDLEPLRTTTMLFTDGSEDTQKEVWADPHY